MKTIIASGPVIIESDQVLVNKHGDSNLWKFPGGKLEDKDLENLKKDILEKVCKREVKEEMGIEVEIIMPLKPLFLQKDDNTRMILIHYLSKRKGEIKPGEDIKEWKWVDINNLPNDCSKNIKPVLEQYLKITQKN